MCVNFGVCLCVCALILSSSVNWTTLQGTLIYFCTYFKPTLVEGAELFSQFMISSCLDLMDGSYPH